MSGEARPVLSAARDRPSLPREPFPATSFSALFLFSTPISNLSCYPLRSPQPRLGTPAIAGSSVWARKRHIVFGGLLNSVTRLLVLPPLHEKSGPHPDTVLTYKPAYTSLTLCDVVQGCAPKPAKGDSLTRWRLSNAFDRLANGHRLAGVFGLWS
jgi:hypothetical protein